MRIHYRRTEKNAANILFTILWRPLWGTANMCRTSDKTVIWQALKKWKFFIGSQKQKHITKGLKVKSKFKCIMLKRFIQSKLRALYVWQKPLPRLCDTKVLNTNDCVLLQVTSIFLSLVSERKLQMQRNMSSSGAAVFLSQRIKDAAGVDWCIKGLLYDQEKVFPVGSKQEIPSG